ncbi:pyrimidine-nucleoside phosphorylase [Cohnella lubricantis]|uniref:Pyrimidine-nucleoside phosphorylase n=1 Tax=Cohnella lubricantis TaxID=2163172 RepID=A0A841TCE4_9BACL|nr:pyrimidine-nucleoside phosphorylase [Cohnella lubricantis]MBB6677685.1 pyrimidine-nucleoside phosphorylase [Cohnella lubricantis]MBP2117646.1 pyrimidine-nucleoside phosphorylase [Cohnella lubricantis]
MRAVDMIRKKRIGEEMTDAEIRFLVDGVVKGTIPDYQAAAWAMAVCFTGMTARETASLTMAMAESGDLVDLSGIRGVKVDKHSTGGVGDKTTLILAPLVASCGVPIAKMSGRGLGHTGGTIDKLESIAGFRTELSREEFFSQVNEIGAAVIGQSGNIAPADKKLYALRDVTGTVDSIPLIASSVMSKKIAAGADAILLDVKFGSGAFMKTAEDAIALAEAMVAIGTEVGRNTIAAITDMDQPLGRNIGNALEVREAIDVLRGEGPSDLRELCLALGSHMLVLGGKSAGEADARAMLEQAIASGAALRKLAQLIAAQGGDPAVAEQPELLPRAAAQVRVVSSRDGYVHGIDAEEIGVAAMRLGAGRAAKEDKIDFAVGLELVAKRGDRVGQGDTLAILHARADDETAASAREQVLAAYAIESEPPEATPLIHAVVSKDGVRR